MTPLNSDIYQTIFYFLPISDARSFIRTCKIVHQLSIHMPSVERKFQKMINDTGFFYHQYYSGLYYPLYKYSVELLYDAYDVPDKYIIPENRILHRFPKIYKKLAERGNINLIKKILKLNSSNAIYVMQGAAKGGHINILEWMIDNNYQRYDSAVTGAISRNRIDILKWLLGRGWKQNPYAVSRAAQKGHFDIVKFLVNKGWWVYDAGPSAAVNGHFNIVKYLCSVVPGTIFYVANGAAAGGHLDILKYAYDNGDTMANIFSCMYVHIYEWLIENNLFRYNIQIVEYVAHNGNLECLQYIYSKGYNILDKGVFAEAVRSRNIEMINWLHELNCPFDEDVVNAAVDSLSKVEETLVVLKLLINWGHKFPDNICSIVIQNGDLETLKFLYAQGCVINKYDLATAASNGHLHIIIWCRQHKCEWDANVCRSTVSNYHLEVLKWLRGIDRDICGLESNETEICPWDETVCIDAIEYRHIDILKFALENGCEVCDTCLGAAMESKNSKILYYVRDNHSRNAIGKKD